jgi:hypothetical protein
MVIKENAAHIFLKAMLPILSSKLTEFLNIEVQFFFWREYRSAVRANSATA